MSKLFRSEITALVLLGSLLFASLYLLSAATVNSKQFGQLYTALLLANLVALIILVILIGSNVRRLLRQYRSRVPGTRLTIRMVLLFISLAVVPVSVVYYFSLQFIQRGIDSWFDVNIDQAMDDALDLSRSALDDRMREYLSKSDEMASELALVPKERITFKLDDLREQSGATELTLLKKDGRIIATSSANPTVLLPNRPSSEILSQLRQGQPYVALDPIGESGLHVRVVLRITGMGPIAEPSILQALFPINERLNALAGSIQSGYAQYQQLSYLRQPLKLSFTITLSLVLLLSLLTAIWAAFFSARRMVAPIRILAIGTRAVAAGDYNKRLPASTTDELGFLVQSFNDMTQKIALARDQVQASQVQAERQRAYLGAVLARLSSGVLTLDENHTLRTANNAAAQILGLDMRAFIGQPLDEIVNDHPNVGKFIEAVEVRVKGSEREWREEITLFGASGRQVLMCGGASLAGSMETASGYVVVFDDITNLVQAQRDAAWGEVARRLAHEIRNPLTPIQLSAERLRHKYLSTMEPADAEVLDRATHTIVQQVEAMKEMVKAFSEYARPPSLVLQALDLNNLVDEVLDLYRGDNVRVRILVDLDRNLPKIAADAGRIRQLIHNLFKNALEALGKEPNPEITVTTQYIKSNAIDFVELRFQDNGPGIPSQLIGQLFEPYVTTKIKGSGLGLAIVKKIVDEHGGVLWAENVKGGGACVAVRLPCRTSVAGLNKQPTTNVAAVSGSIDDSDLHAQSNPPPNLQRKTL